MIDWISYSGAGLYCIPGEFHIDPPKAVAKAVVSHAHADHYPRFSHEVFATPETLAIGKVRYLNNAAKIGHSHSYGDSFDIGPVKVTFLSAGHILGSAQIILEYRGERMLYTGDISFDVNPTCTPIEIPTVTIDTVVCESTFGEKELHPPAQIALQRCLEEAGKRPILIGTYVLGKAQRINRLLQDLRPDIPIFVDRTIAPINRVYTEFGMLPGQNIIYRRQEVKRCHRQYVWLLPPQKLTGFANDKLYHKVFASGWDNTNRAAWLNGMLEISDHASQSEIQQYIEQIAPTSVRFWHGYPQSLIAACLKAGIDAGELT